MRRVHQQLQCDRSGGLTILFHRDHYRRSSNQDQEGRQAPKGHSFSRRSQRHGRARRYTDIDQDEVGGWELPLGLHCQSGQGQNEAGRDTSVYLDRPGLKPLKGRRPRLESHYASSLERSRWQVASRCRSGQRFVYPGGANQSDGGGYRSQSDVVSPPQPPAIRGSLA